MTYKLNILQLLLVVFEVLKGFLGGHDLVWVGELAGIHHTLLATFIEQLKMGLTDLQGEVDVTHAG